MDVVISCDIGIYIYIYVYFFYCYPYNQLLLFYFLCMKDHFIIFTLICNESICIPCCGCYHRFDTYHHYKWIGIFYRVIEIFISHNCSEFFFPQISWSTLSVYAIIHKLTAEHLYDHSGINC